MLHLENLGKVMDSFIKENPTHFFFGDNGLLMSLEKLAKVNGLGIFYPPPTALHNGFLLRPKMDLNKLMDAEDPTHPLNGLVHYVTEAL